MTRTVTLIDGRPVPSDSDEWRMECLARVLLALPLDERRAWLGAVEKRRGETAANRLRAAMTALHQAKKRAAAQPQSDPTLDWSSATT